MKEESDHLSVIETILHIQEEAFQAIGVNRYTIKDQFLNEKRQLELYLQESPEFLRPKKEILEKDPDMGYFNFDLADRYNALSDLLPYQSPYLFNWLKDILKYHEVKLGQRPIVKPVILATAPTGRFNAISLFGKDQDGILIEDGLLNVAQKAAYSLSKLFYKKIADGKFLELEAVEWKRQIEKDATPLDEITDTIFSYITEGYYRQKTTVSGNYQDDFSIRHVVFISFMSFVLDHENFHLHKKNGLIKNDPDFFEERYLKIWNFFESHLADKLPLTISEAEFRPIYFQHQEELLADIHGIKSVIGIAETDNTVSTSILGVMMFFMLSELIEYSIIRLTEPEFLNNLYNTDGLTLSLTAMLMKESHPYAHSRRHGIASAIKLRFPKYVEIIEEQNDKIDQLLDALKQRIDTKIKVQKEAPKVHPKWKYGKALR